jgi:hypothetical protein
LNPTLQSGKVALGCFIDPESGKNFGGMCLQNQPASRRLAHPRRTTVT